MSDEVTTANLPEGQLPTTPVTEPTQVETLPLETTPPVTSTPEETTQPVETPPVTETAPVIEQSENAPVKIFYMGNEVVEKLEKVTADGRECRLADGSTTYVPLSILGE